jgi:hypothetical protein
MAYVDPKTGEPDDNDDPTLIDEHDIYNEGYDASEAGKDKFANPWPEDSYASGVWEDGWEDYDMNKEN